LAISDNGIGFKRPQAGNGMGLRTMQYRAGMIGAALLVQAQAKGGTRIDCFLQNAGRPERPMKASQEARAPRAKILIVDDHPMMRDGLAQLIGNQPDMEVCGQAGDAHEALEKVRSSNRTWFWRTSPCPAAMAWS
jgi:hypothetical protein